MTPNAIEHVGLEQLKKNRPWFLILGIILILAGTIAIGEAFLMTKFSIKFLGWIMVFAGVATGAHAFSLEKGWGGFFLNLITGVLYVVAGYIFLISPLESAVYLTLLIALVLIFEGAFRAITALTTRFPHWIWVFISGAVTMLLGIMISNRWPLSGLWVIGLFVGINMILNGWSLVMLSMAVKNLPEGEGEEAGAAAQ